MPNYEELLAQFQNELNNLRNKVSKQELEIAELKSEQIAVVESKPSRRQLIKQLGLATATVAAGVAGLASINSAQAASGDNVILGNSNVASTPTYFSQTNGANPAAIMQVDYNPTTTTPLPTGANIALAATSTGIGGYFQGTTAPLVLKPNSGGAPSAGTPHQRGELYVDGAGKLYFYDGAVWLTLGSSTAVTGKYATLQDATTLGTPDTGSVNVSGIVKGASVQATTLTSGSITTDGTAAIGGYFQGTTAPLLLAPSTNPGLPPANGGPYSLGQLYTDVNGELYLYKTTAPGIPGTWNKVSGGGTTPTGTYVSLQSGTQGAVDNGNINVSGTVKAAIIQSNIISTGTITTDGNSLIGATFKGSAAPILLTPAANSTNIGAPTGSHSKGELYTDYNGDLYLCQASGTPGTWVRVNPPVSGALSLYLLAKPLRYIETRTTAANTTYKSATPLGDRVGGGNLGTYSAGETREYKVGGTTNIVVQKNDTPPSTPPVPANAKAVLGIVAAIANNVPFYSYLSIYPASITLSSDPQTSTCNYGGNGTGPTVGSVSFTSVLSSYSGYSSLKIYAYSGCDIILDVVGYYL